MLRAVIFDFDGVIADSEMLHLRSFNRIFAPFGVKISTPDYYKKYLGLTDYDCLKEVCQTHQLGLDEEAISQLVDKKNLIFEDVARTENKIIDGVPEFLEMLRENDVTMAICSGALQTEIQLILQQANLLSFFEIIVSAEQVAKGKPDPEGFQLTLKKLNNERENRIRAKQCIVIEDSHWGLDAAGAADMHSIAVTNSYDAEQLASAEKIVSQLNELKIEDLYSICD